MIAERPGALAPHRILVAKPGLDGHDRGAKVVARALRDAGFEVGLHRSSARHRSRSSQRAVQEDVRAVGLSILSGAHNTLLPEVVEGLHVAGADDVLVFAGGIVPDADIAGLKAAGVDEVFPPGSSTAAIVEYLNRRLAAAGPAGEAGR